MYMYPLSNQTAQNTSTIPEVAPRKTVFQYSSREKQTPHKNCHAGARREWHPRWGEGMPSPSLPTHRLDGIRLQAIRTSPHRQRDEGVHAEKPFPRGGDAHVTHLQLSSLRGWAATGGHPRTRVRSQFRTFLIWGKVRKTQVKSHLQDQQMKNTSDQGHNQEKCQRSAPQSTQKCVYPKEKSLLHLSPCSGTRTRGSASRISHKEPSRSRPNDPA